MSCCAFLLRFCPASYVFLLGFQVHYLLKDIDPKFLKKFVPAIDSLFLNSFPVTPNSHRVTEMAHSFSNGQRLIFVRLFFLCPVIRLRLFKQEDV